MRFLILRTDPSPFFRWLYSKYPGLEGRPYEEQLQARRNNAEPGDAYARSLRVIGHEAYDIYANDESMQKAWASEYGCSVNGSGPQENLWEIPLRRLGSIAPRTALNHLRPFLRPVSDLVDKQSRPWFYRILAAQIAYYQPDVLLNQAMHTIHTAFIKKIKGRTTFIVGQIASPLPKFEDFHCYDLVVSALPSFVQYFRRRGVRAELLRWAFDPEILNLLRNDRKNIAVSFVGSLSWRHRYHKPRARLLEYLCEQLPDMEVWGEGVDELPENSSIRQRYRGTAWGIEMYEILHKSKIVLNQHADNVRSDAYAGNRRLYEATGVGTMLITDWKTNLHEIFDPEKETVVYRTPAECLQQIRHYLEHDRKRETIARAGQEHTLSQHTYSHRSRELVGIIHQYF
jgi:spore maturation protein CgeB